MEKQEINTSKKSQGEKNGKRISEKEVKKKENGENERIERKRKEENEYRKNI